MVAKSTTKAVAATKKAPAQNALRKFEEKFSKDFGPDVLRRTSEVKPYDVIPTGSLLLDYATGIGGLPVGRLIEWWGPDGTGKTTLSLLAIAEAQKKYPDRMAAFVDMEQTLDQAWAKKLGVDLDLMYHVQPESAEDLADIVKAMIDSDAVSLLVVDSIGGMVTEEEMEKDAEKDVVGTLAKVVTRMVKIAAVEARKTNTTVLLLNQVRAKIGGYGFDETTGGGWALKHATSMRMRFRRTGTTAFKVGDDEVGYEVAITVEKNKCAPPKKKAEVTMFNTATPTYGNFVGVDRCTEAAILADTLGIFEKSGSWFVVDKEADEKYNGRPALVEHLRTNPVLVQDILDRAVAGVSHLVTDSDAPPPEEPKKNGFRRAGDA